ncbi:hypothetical protein PH210_17065 [Paenibacillus sp. BSR1-1]|uniref:hypothetical protein n=1 Tax=Paenibacillus sp. BSR1-1 TaxID=3020845 RepID=UPI0025B1E7CE|nr:hypothetical protein [Paenibacillus sp. BSR1-1]MDN3017908.1 hypothetical protein [Paenibacillus sp. BSR1-1]
MKMVYLLGTTLLVLLMVLSQLEKINKNQKKDKVVLIVFSVFGWLIAILLIFFPDVPGPSELIDVLYKPLGKLLE